MIGLVIRLMPIIMVGWFWYTSPKTFKRVVTNLRHGPRIVFTTIDMGNARNVLAEEILLNDRWPTDVPAFLRSQMSSVSDPALDKWGNLYVLEQRVTPTLVSYGPDGQGGTEDDIEMPLWVKKKKKPGQHDPYDRFDRD